MASTNLSRANGSGSATTKFTYSVWLKYSGWYTGGQRFFSATGGSGDTYFRFNEDGTLEISGDNSAATSLGYFITNRKFRDHSAWMHIVIKVDTTQSTQTDRFKLYINGVDEAGVGGYSTGTYPNQNADDNISLSSNTHYIGGAASSQYFNGLMTHIHYSDGYAYDASTFGETDSTSGIWKPKTSPTGITYGTNGYFLKFENSGAMGTDSSGNSNTFSVGNGTLTQNVDTPSNNFATLNGIHVGGGASTLSNGNTTYSLSNYSYNTRSTLGMPSGKFYWEQKQSNTSTRIGLITSGFTTDLDTDNANAYYGGSGGGGVYILLSGTGTSWQYTNNDTSQNTGTYTNAIASGANDILMGAVDVDAGKLWIGVNGVWFNSGNPATGSNATLTFTNNSGDDLQIFAGYGTSSARVSSFNFGQGYFGTTAVASAGTAPSEGGIFEYDCPSGYQALCTKGINSF